MALPDPLVPAIPPFDPEHFLAPARTTSLPNAFFIGPYGRRVSFASQQRRALNTVWAMETADCITAGDRVAVIGAGLAGVMAAVALTARGMRVWVYEENPSALRRQSQTSHRWVHPSINFWPEEGLRPSTRFPFFDWAAGVCNSIVNDIDQEWKALVPKLKKDLTLHKFHINTPVDSVVAGADGLRTVCKAHSDREGTFKAVVIATGFGQENIIPSTGTVSYWRTDPVEDRVRDSERTRFLVSGTGDGGLIDTLRLLHRDFDTGKFCLTIAHALNEAAATDELIKVEEAARAAFAEARDAEQARIATGATGNAMKVGQQAAAAAFAKCIARYIVHEMPDGVSDLLNASLINDRKRKVKLVGELIAPYSLNAAPIHKLIIAHAIGAGVLDYRPGRLEEVNDELVIFDDVGAHAEASEFTITRHGSTLPLEQFIPDAEERLDLQRRQERAEGWLRDDVVPGDFFDYDGMYPGNDIKDPMFMNVRLVRAQNFVRDFAGGWVDLRPNEAFYRVTPHTALAFEKEKVPTDLFGIPIRIEDRRPRYRRGTARQR